jgi:hypothetical protein
MNLDALIDRWSVSGDAERTSKDSFLNELCDVLGVERPHPKTGDPARDLSSTPSRRMCPLPGRGGRGYGQWLP